MSQVDDKIQHIIQTNDVPITREQNRLICIDKRHYSEITSKSKSDAHLKMCKNFRWHKHFLGRSYWLMRLFNFSCSYFVYAHVWLTYQWAFQAEWDFAKAILTKVDKWRLI